MKSDELTIGEFLTDRLGRYVFQAVFIMLAAVFLYVTGTQGGILLLLFGTWLLAFLGLILYDYWRCRSRLRELGEIMDNLDKKYLFAECVPKAVDAYERRIMELTKKAGRAMIREVSAAKEAQQEYREYVESWVHEIKTPITAAELICGNAGGEIQCKLSAELIQIEAHVERVLFYARAESPEKDFLIRPVSIAKIVGEAIRRHQALLIQSGMCVETRDLDQTVYTDEKWAIFIVGQLLQNAVRYRKEQPGLFLSAEQSGQKCRLTIKDNGIGILPHELPRVFERGFTGSNGRTHGSSTGMGLYLCRKLGNLLEIELQISSKEGEGTEVILTFPAKELQKCKIK